MAEKTEKATPKKLRDARKKGQVAKIQDFPSVFTFIVSIAGSLALAGYLFDLIATFTLQMFRSVTDQGFETKAPGYLYMAAETILKASAPIMIATTFVGVLVTFLVIGPVFSFEPMKFELKKLNPIEGIKQKFKLKTLVELLKSIFKITGAAIIIYHIIYGSLPEVISAAAMSPLAAVPIVEAFLTKVVIQVGLFFFLISLFDLAFQKAQFAKEMKMEKFEVKQEYKDTEGNPEIKGKRREQFREIAYQDGPVAARRARAIVTNPTHIAVALKYDEPEDPAPIILTMGAGMLAEQIIKIGLENKIPVMRNVELARMLYDKGKISDYIPEDAYKAVSEILKWVKALEGSPDINMDIFRET
jgi:type III secretion protein U